MSGTNLISEELIAPCGLNCALCSRHLAFVFNLRRSQCPGCRARGERCGYLFGKCTGVNHGRNTASAVFCAECQQYPCRQIRRVDKRYKTDYGASPCENLAEIRQSGMTAFLEREAARHSCPRCGGVLSIHNGKCFACDTVTRLIEKLPRAEGKRGRSPSDDDAPAPGPKRRDKSPAANRANLRTGWKPVYRALPVRA